MAKFTVTIEQVRYEKVRVVYHGQLVVEAPDEVAARAVADKITDLEFEESPDDFIDDWEVIDTETFDGSTDEETVEEIEPAAAETEADITYDEVFKETAT